MTKSFQDASGWGRAALGLQNWQRTPQREKKSEDGASIAGDENWFLSLTALRSRETSANAFAFAAPLSLAVGKAELAASAAGTLPAIPATSEAATSNPVVILGGTPSPAVAGGITGSMLPTTPAVATPASAPLCCGSCGYINCPTQAMSQGQSGATQLAGQMVHSSAPDFVPTDKSGLIGSSTSAAMSTQNVAPVANWNTQLPGGGEAGNTILSGLVGVLGGSVTTATPQTAPTASPSLRAAALPAGAATMMTAAAATTTATADATSTNPIVLENEKPGNPESEWGIDGAGDSNIEGFATDISVNHGTTVSFKINTDSTDYRIDIYRLGYYGGMGARKVATMEHTGLQVQPAPLRDDSTGLVDAGNWSVSASWDVPADAVSGVYIA